MAKDFMRKIEPVCSTDEGVGFVLLIALLL